MRLAPILAIAFLCCASAVGVLAFNAPSHSMAKIAAQAQPKSAPIKPWTSRVLTQKIPYREIQSLNWMADNRRLWIVKKSFAKAQTSITSWDVTTNHETTRDVPSYTTTRDFLPSAYSNFLIGFHYAQLPDHFWQKQKSKSQNSEAIEPLLVTPKFTVGWDSDRDGLKIIWRDVQSREVMRTSRVKLPRDSDYYLGGGCGQLGPHIQLSRDGEIGFLTLFEQDIAHRILVFDPRSGKTLRILKLFDAPDEMNDFYGIRSTPDGKHLLVYEDKLMNADLGTWKHELQWRDAQTGDLIHAWPVKQHKAVEISDDGSLVATYFQERNSVRIYDTKSGALKREIKCQGKDTQLGDAVIMKFSPDNRFLAATDENFKKGETVTVWKLQ